MCNHSSTPYGRRETIKMDRGPFLCFIPSIVSAKTKEISHSEGLEEFKANMGRGQRWTKMIQICLKNFAGWKNEFHRANHRIYITLTRLVFSTGCYYAVLC
jgi:hypothetical protein